MFNNISKKIKQCVDKYFEGSFYLFVFKIYFAF